MPYVCLGEFFYQCVPISIDFIQVFQGGAFELRGKDVLLLPGGGDGGLGFLNLRLECADIIFEFDMTLFQL